MLREECRIIGKLTGSLPRAPRQNNHLGLPLQLMPEEAKLLVELGKLAWIFLFINVDTIYVDLMVMDIFKIVIFLYFEELLIKIFEAVKHLFDF